MMMQMIRSTAGKIIVPVLMLFFLGWMVFEIGMDALGGGLQGGPGNVGTVNGSPMAGPGDENRFGSTSELRRCLGAGGAGGAAGGGRQGKEEQENPHPLPYQIVHPGDGFREVDQQGVCPVVRRDTGGADRSGTMET